MVNQIIDVMVVFDAETIVKKVSPGTEQSPAYCPHDLIHMVTNSGNVISGNAGAELNIAAQVGDGIRWRKTTLSFNTNYRVILYKFVATGGQDLISPPQPILVNVKVPLPDPADPTNPSTQVIKQDFWQCISFMEGRVMYHFYFMIMDRDQNVLGYYWWDPYITIKN